jgi:hypothetical protein
MASSSNPSDQSDEDDDVTTSGTALKNTIFGVAPTVTHRSQSRTRRLQRSSSAATAIRAPSIIMVPPSPKGKESEQALVGEQLPADSTKTIKQLRLYTDTRIDQLEARLNKRMDGLVTTERFNKLVTIVEGLDHRMDDLAQDVRQILANQSSAADQRAADRYPKDPAFMSGGLRPPSPPNRPTPDQLDPESSSDLSNPSTLRPELKIKREDMGMFNPDADDPKNTGVLTEGRNIVFTDVFSFEQRVLSLLEVEPEDVGKINRQLVQHFNTCLAGSALLWWINEVGSDRLFLKAQGIEALLTALVERFKPTDTESMELLYQSKFSSWDLLTNSGALRQYVQRQYRIAHSLGMVNSSTNPYPVLLTIWNTFDIKGQTWVRRPQKTWSFADYMKEIKEASPILANIVSKSKRPDPPNRSNSGYRGKDRFQDKERLQERGRELVRDRDKDYDKNRYQT